MIRRIALGIAGALVIVLAAPAVPAAPAASPAPAGLAASAMSATLTASPVSDRLAASPGPGPQMDNGKRPLSHDDYDDWKSIRGERIAADGQWVAYSAVPQEGDGELVVRRVADGREYRHPRGTDARFTADVNHVVFLIAPPEEEVEKASDENKPPEDRPKNALGIMDLSDGSVVTVERVKSFELPENVGGWVAYLLEGPTSEEKKAAEAEREAAAPPAGEEAEEEEEEKEYGTPLILRGLADDSEWAADSVLEYRFTDEAEWLLYTVSSEEEPATDGVYGYQPAAGIGTAILTGEGNYRRWALDEQETRLAFVTDRDDYAAEQPTFNLYGWSVGRAQAQLWVSHERTDGFPAGMAVSDKSPMAFTDDGGILMFGIKEIPEPQPEEDEETDDDEERAEFDLWHWDDPYPQPQQLQIREQVLNETWETVYHLDSGRLVKLADADVPDVSLSDDGAIAYATSDVPYRKLVSWDGRYNDIWLVDPNTGDRTLVAEKIRGFGARLSPGGKYVAWFDHRDYDWYVHDVARGTTTNVTAGLDVQFDQEDHDRPEPANPYGMAGWTRGDASLLIYDRYDIWEVRPDGSGARMITEGFGRDNDLSFRYVRLDPEEDSIAPDEPLLLRTTNEKTMASGFWRDRVAGDVPPIELVMADRSYGFPQKAERADALMFTRSAFDEYPDLWVTDLDFSAAKRVSHLGSQMAPFLWGEAELRDFYSADGMALKGILIKPEGFDPGRQYPLMVYIYETLHQGLHSFRNPSPGTSVNPSYYVSNGYVIWMPDIEYGTGYPGQDALKCVLPGIHMLIGEGYIDPERVGIQGHSWGGYQIAYMVTQTDVFAAAEAGAPVSNMTSAYGGIRWGSGMVRQFQYEQTQSRLGASLWEVPLRYIENSPIFWADKIETPLLILHNDEDGAVPWYQGIEFIMALRRLGKEAYMFNYNGEEHGLRQRVNQKDYTVRMQQFFDHFLKGAPEPEWMKEGIRAWEKGKTEN